MFFNTSYYTICDIYLSKKVFISTTIGLVTLTVPGEGRKGRLGTWGGIVLNIFPEKRSICVSFSAAVAGLSDTITEEYVSCDLAGETPQGQAG